MALRDVKEYYGKMLSQYLIVKDDLKDFEQGLKDGYITEDQLQDAIEDVNKVKENLDRLAYILFLFNLPKKKSKRIKAKQNNQNIEDYFKELHADSQSVIDESIDLTEQIREEFKKLNIKK